MSELTPLAHASAGNETGVGTSGDSSSGGTGCEPIHDPHTAAPWGHYAQPPQNDNGITYRRGLP